MPGSSVLPFLWMGVTLANLKSTGTWPCCMERLIMWVMAGVMVVAESLRNLEGIVSRPVALCWWRVLSFLSTSVVVTISSLKSSFWTPSYILMSY